MLVWAQPPQDTFPAVNPSPTPATATLALPHGNTIDLGTFSGDSLATGGLPLVNASADTLAITSVFAECGCTRVEYPSDPFLPGDTIALSVSYNPANRPYGRFCKAVRVRLNRGKPLVILVKGNVRRPYRKPVGGL